MNRPDPIAALEIGTSRTVLAVGDPLGPGRVKMLALAAIPSTGVRKGSIVDEMQAAISVESVLRRAEAAAGCTINQVNLVLNGTHIRTKLCSAQWQINGAAVTDEDLVEVYNQSVMTGLDPAERTLLDVSELGYGLDERENILQPKGLTGRLLRLYTLCIHGAARCTTDARNAVASRAKLAVADNFFAGACAARAVLTPEQMRDGALCIDLGAGCTSYTVWNDGHLVYANVLGVGGDHVTNDVSLAFSITRSQAEQAKREGHARVGADYPAPRLDIPSTTPGFAPASLSRRALDTVVNARLQELFTIIRTELDRENLLHRLNAGVFLTGGVSAQPEIAALATLVFGRPASVGRLVPGIEGLDAETHPAACASVAGAILTAMRNVAPESGGGILAPFRRLFGGLFGK